MSRSLAYNVCAALAYSEVFHFPLTRDEVWYWLVTGKSVSKQSVFQTLSTLVHLKIVYERNEYFGLSKKTVAVSRSIKKEISRDKIILAQKKLWFIRFIPTVLLVGISGAVASGNTHNHDDIDIFVISKKNTVWMTRMLFTVITSLLGIRRTPRGKNVSNKLCLNMFLAENVLNTPSDKQNLFTAHEILQLVILFDRGFWYNEFLNKNQWMRSICYYAVKNRFQKKKLIRETQTSWFVRIFESIVRAIQMRYLKRRHTTEIIEQNRIMFHPQDASLWVMAKYEKNMKKVNRVCKTNSL